MVAISYLPKDIALQLGDTHTNTYIESLLPYKVSAPSKFNICFAFFLLYEALFICVMVLAYLYICKALKSWLEAFKMGVALVECQLPYRVIWLEPPTSVARDGSSWAAQVSRRGQVSGGEDLAVRALATDGLSDVTVWTGLPSHLLPAVWAFGVLRTTAMCPTCCCHCPSSHSSLPHWVRENPGFGEGVKIDIYV